MKEFGKENKPDNADSAEQSRENDILVSIIFTESTSSLLNLDIPNLEDCATVEQSTCIIKPVPLQTIGKPAPSVISYIFGEGPNRSEEEDQITTEVGFFSDHFNSESIITVDLTDDEDEGEWLPELTFTDEDQLTPMRQNLYPVRVYMKPFVNAKTTLNENNISIKDNDILVTLIGADDDCSSVCSELICRICHGGESVGDLLRPCRCRGTIALVHVECLEHWLRESANSSCELCKHHYKIVRQPRYNLLWSIYMYLTSPGEHFRELVIDTLAFIFYTPSAIATTYMLMIICENMAKAHLNRTRNLSAHFIAFFAIFGMAAIDFTYSSWLILTIQKHAYSWSSWYRNNSYLKVVLPEYKRRAYSRKEKPEVAGCSKIPTHFGMASISTE